MRWCTNLLWLVLATALLAGAGWAQPITLPQVGGFEPTAPSYWSIGSAPSGATLTWATDQFRSLGHSLKIEKSGATADSAAWISYNMCDIWAPIHNKNVDILLGAFVKTQGVNTNPSSDDQRWYVAFDFWDSAGAFIGETKLPIDQSVASSTGWVADTNAPGITILPEDSWTTIVKFVAGKNATGTVWADDFVFYGRGNWAGQDWNTSVGVPTGWYYWLPPNGGNDGLLNDGFENTLVTSEAAHSGAYSLKFDMPHGRVQHDGFVGTHRIMFSDLGTGGPIHEGDKLRLSVWIKASSLVPDSADAYPGTWSVGFTPLWFTGNGNNLGYNPVGPSPDYTFKFPHVTQFDWTKYTLDITVPSGVGAQALEIRLHVYSRFEGIVYFDDVAVEKVTEPTLADVGGFEGTLPAYWSTKVAPTGATLTWATDQFMGIGHSLKIDKPGATADSAAWISDNMCDIWAPIHNKNVDILLGAYVKTQGVNTSPTSDDQRWYVAFDFWDSAGVFIGETKLPIDQSVATSTGWVADTNAPGVTILPEDSWTTIVKFVAGKNATGTVWADDFVFYGRGNWAGQDWNTSPGVPTWWYYWLPPNGGNDGLFSDGFENTRVTNEAAHSGTSSLKFDMPHGRVQHDGFVATKRIMFSDLSTDKTIAEGDSLKLSVWIKASSLVPDSAALYPGTWSVGFTPLWFVGNGNNLGYNPVGPANDYTWAFPAVTSFDWTQYSLNVEVPKGVGAQALEIRLHVYSRFEGTIYFDDVTAQNLGGPSTGVADAKSGLPKTFELLQNYPNPFNPTTNIRYALPKEAHVTLVIYNILGQKVRTLVDDYQSPGRFEVTWDGRDEHGFSVGSGMYLYRIEAGQYLNTQKMLLLK